MINLIAAVGFRGRLGYKGVIPWHDKEDLQWFKSLTMGGLVVVGWKTAQTLPELKGRTVISMDRKTPEEIILLHGSDLWIAGGAKTYEQWMPFIQRFYISRIDYKGSADTWLPELRF